MLFAKEIIRNAIRTYGAQQVQIWMGEILGELGAVRGRTPVAEMVDNVVTLLPAVKQTL